MTIVLLKFLVDESTGIQVAQKLKQMGYDTVSVIKAMKGAQDTAIIKKAKQEDRIIITNDKDFGWLAAIYKPPGIIILRLKDESIKNKVKVALRVIENPTYRIYGCIIVATEKKIRIRRL